jgi:hypothetical protein
LKNLWLIVLDRKNEIRKMREENNAIYYDFFIIYLKIIFDAGTLLASRLQGIASAFLLKK